MVAHSLKNLVRLTREAVRDVRQVVEELVSQAGQRHEPQPALVRIPVRNTNGRAGNPFNSGRRQFSTARVIRAQSGTLSQAQFKYSGHFWKNVSKPVQHQSGLANRMWPYSAFRRPMGRAGAFPASGLYRHFVQTNARNFGTYSCNFSREAVQNLTASLRCLFKNGTDGLMNMKMKDTQQCGSDLIYSSVVNDDVLQTFKLARTESSGVERVGCFVEFELPNLELTIPSMSFIDSEIVGSLEKTFQEMKAQIDRVYFNIQLIFDSYGSLPMERSARSIKIHFPNSESWEVENLLVDIGIAEGIVHANESTGLYSMTYSTRSNSSTSMSALSSTTERLANYLRDVAPDLISTESMSSVDSESIDGFYPVLSTSDEIQSPSVPGSVAHSSSIDVISV